MEAMKTTEAGQKMVCAVCGDAERHCEPVCQSCLSIHAMRKQSHRQSCELAEELLEWARTFEGTWKDNSDAEVAMEEIRDLARLMIPPEGADED